MKTLQATIIIIKPDVEERSLLNELLALVEAYKLTIVAETTIKADLNFIKLLYGWDTIQYPIHINDYLCSGPMKVMMLVGSDAVANALRLKPEFRGRYQKPNDKLHTLIHCPDSSEMFAHEFRVITERSAFVFREAHHNRRDSQVQVIPYAESPTGPMTLLMKRSEKRGGFWQVITGGVKPGEDVMFAGFREMYEETKLLPMELLGPIYEYDFTETMGTLHESVFIGRMDGCYPPVLSNEHVECRWVRPETAYDMLKWPGNKAAMEAFAAWCRGWAKKG